MVFGRYRHGHNRVPISAVVWRNGHDAQIMAACALGATVANQACAFTDSSA
ncbi:hypothetical protein BCGT_1600 [Mycobacterium tuberculosis variant bovis BCG str. ATCC 35743]|nr:hypothetical protein BCGT_1600 [Mycobacterium tuberculosis variant bovis BCG str. ATCC 35743]AIB48390.1 hypothetical protein MTBK_18440 [Mycobacterium tuberculosis K]AKR01512.1 hypothetical protein Mb1595_p1989 [Mycobacterium tuberculosis variant bovis]ALA78259.1 Uncharacterized protein BCGR_1942 [Mycobacterium tuberculosis variant bovis BCG]KXN96775.1 hypothetical protein HX91_0841 [Mycobacterium tuberculosis]BAQ05792.1 hypothetical protein KURONO_1996 [Mycobacterium tuberculosis str. Kuro